MKVVEMVQNDSRPELMKHMWMKQIDADQCDAAHVLLWTKSTLEFRKKTTKEVENDIRRYFQTVWKCIKK